MNWSEVKIGFIGAGNMAKAIGFSILSKDVLNPDQIIVSAPSDQNLSEWRSKGTHVTNKNSDIVEFSNIIFLSVKPQYFQDVMVDLKKSNINFTGKCLVSIMVGVAIKKIRQVMDELYMSNSEVPCIRVMPNTPLLVGHGCSVMCTDWENNPWMESVKEIMSLAGTCDVIKESLIDAVSAVSGSGPAYMYMVVEALSDGAVKCGVPRDMAIRLAAQTMVGGGQMVLSGTHPGVLKDQVCSPGGTTIAAIHALEKSKIRAAFMDAVEAAFTRAKQFN